MFVGLYIAEWCLLAYSRMVFADLYIAECLLALVILD